MKISSISVAVSGLLLLASTDAAVVTKTIRRVVTQTAVASPGRTTVQPNQNKAVATSNSQPPPKPAPKSNPPPPKNPSSGGLGGFEQALLDAHNKDRQSVGYPKLSWDSGDLLKHAKDYANTLCGIKKLVHSGTSGMGENLYWVSSSNVDQKKLADNSAEAWWSEKKDYHPGSYSHYTQMVWKGTTKVACAAKDSGSGTGTYVVCNYNPQGNIIGKFNGNVP